MIKGIDHRLEDIRIYRYAIPFKRPLPVGDKILEVREGLVVELVDESGAVGYGEIAPLPGFSHETLEQAHRQVTVLARKMPGMLLLDNMPDMPLYPPVRFGMETAIVNLLKSYLKKTFAQGMEKKPLIPIRVNGLLHLDITVERDHVSVVDSVGHLVESGFSTIKIKVARGPVDLEIEMTNRIAALLPPGILLRLDANQRWDYEQALEFGSGVSAAKCVIEYIEEPFAAEATAQLESFSRITGIPLALDESLETLDPAEAVIPKGVAAFVIKPTLLGGFGRIMDFITLARQHQIKPVISSCFEVGPGFVELCKLVLTIDFARCAAGLDTLGYLERNLIKTPISVCGGEISIEPLRNNRDLYDLSQLKQLPTLP